MPYKLKDIHRGLILSEFVRAGRNSKLSMIECGNPVSQQVIEINANSYLYFKSGKTLQPRKKKWQFVFSPTNIKQLSKFLKTKPVALALLCCPSKYDAQKTEIAFIHPDKLNALLKLDATRQQIINVELIKGQFQIIGSTAFGTRPKIVAKLNALSRWNP